MPRSHRAPTRDAYVGLLSSGRIARLESELRKDLAHIYHQIGEGFLNVDRELCADLMVRLEKVESGNRLFKLPG